MNAQIAPEVDSPTERAHRELAQAFVHFNNRLFNEELPDCLIRLQANRARRGLFDPNRFITIGMRTAHAIDINPQIFARSTIKEVLADIVHQLCQAWAHKHNVRGRRGYHSAGWAEKMESIGLIPSDTSKPGGKKTGERVGHYIEEGGAFDQAAEEFIATGWTITWLDRIAAPRADDEADELVEQEVLGAPLLGKSALLVSPVTPDHDDHDLPDPSASTTDEDTHSRTRAIASNDGAEHAEPARSVAGHAPAAHHQSTQDEDTHHHSSHHSRDDHHEFNGHEESHAAHAADLVLDTGSKARGEEKPVSEPLIKPAGHTVQGKKKLKDKVKFTCPVCELNAWAKPSAKLGCVKCQKKMKSELGDDPEDPPGDEFVAEDGDQAGASGHEDE